MGLSISLRPEGRKDGKSKATGVDLDPHKCGSKMWLVEYTSAGHFNGKFTPEFDLPWKSTEKHRVPMKPVFINFESCTTNGAFIELSRRCIANDSRTLTF